MQTFQRGIERILRETPVPVVPAALSGMWGSVFSRATDHKKLSQRVWVTVGDTVPPDDASAANLEDIVHNLRGERR